MNKKTFTFAEKNGLKLAADLIIRDTPSTKTVIYFHGGGLLYGTRSDLDSSYIQQFLDGGYNLLLIDYRLAPETKLPDIYEDIQDAILWFEKEATKTLALPKNDFALFGRSAGAFLALVAATDPILPHPFAVLSFYGYFTANATFLHEENAYFQTFPKISESLKKTMIHPEQIAIGPTDTRYPLYIYARQNGKWQELVFGKNAKKQTIDTFDLVPERDFHFLPPLFLAHSFDDQDVPISESETLKNGTLQSELYTVHNLPHDFDTNTPKTDGRLAYDAAIRFLNSIS